MADLASETRFASSAPDALGAAAHGWSLVFQTLISIAISIAVTAGLMRLTLGASLGGTVEVVEVWRMGLAIAVIAPAVIAPLVAFRTGQLVRKLQEARDQLELVAGRDALTGLLNRRGFQSAAAQALARGGPLGLLLGDIDRFKAINDSHGHDVGDLALVHVARVLREAIRAPGAAVSRHGGEEFAILLPGCGLAETRAVAEALRAACEADPPTLGVVVLPITLSVGVAARALGPVSLDALLSEADKGLYEAKQAGRNRVVAIEAWAA